MTLGCRLGFETLQPAVGYPSAPRLEFLMQRRDFLLGSGAVAAALAPGVGRSAPEPGDDIQPVDFVADGLALSPAAYSRELTLLLARADATSDNYSNGGLIGELELSFARRLGKRRAVFLPTGTMANHLALRTLAGPGRRVLVQADSHLYCDSGDGVTRLSGLVLVPLGAGTPGFTLDDVRAQVERAEGGRVPVPVGAISIESPVRRHDHRMFDPTEMRRIAAFARERGIRLHLDGARLFNLPQHSGFAVDEYASLFDTVFVSLWKHFNAASGAVLAGDGDALDELFHLRRTFGGSLPQAWPVAAVALRHLEGYEQRYASAWRVAEALFAALPNDRFEVQRIDAGTSRFWLVVRGVDPALFARRLGAEGIAIGAPAPGQARLACQVNTTLATASAERIAAAFRRASDPA